MDFAYRFTHYGTVTLYFEINKYHFVFEGKRPLAGVVQLRDDLLKRGSFCGKDVSDSFRRRETAGPYELRSLSCFLGPLVAA